MSQQLAVLERETGVKLLERAGRGVRLTDPALVLVGHARVLLERAEQAETDLAAALGSPAGRGRIAAFQSVSLEVAAPAMAALARTAPALRCELVEAEPEEALPALALGDLDLVLADEWPHQPRLRPAGIDRHELFDDPLRIALAEDHPAAGRGDTVRLAELAGDPWVSAAPGMGWSDVTTRICRDHGGFDPDIRHETNDAIVGFRLVAHGLAVMLIPDLVSESASPDGVVLRRIKGASLQRSVFAATRTADARRPSVVALLDAVRAAAAEAGSVAPSAGRLCR